MALKPVPKAILIIAVVSGIGYASMKFMPKSAPAAPEVAAPAPTVVAPPTQAQVDSAGQAAQAAATPAPTPAPETPRPNVSSGDAGLSAVLGAGR